MRIGILSYELAVIHTLIRFCLVVVILLLHQDTWGQQLILERKNGSSGAVLVKSYNKSHLISMEGEVIRYDDITHVTLITYNHVRDKSLVKNLQRNHIPLELATSGQQASLKRQSIPSTPCDFLLKTARATYAGGRLHEVPALLRSCLSGGGFSKEEATEAYKLLTLSYLFLEEPQRTDSSMLLLLKHDHMFSPNAETDPSEFIALYNRYRSWYTVAVGFRFGISQNSAIPAGKEAITSGLAGSYTPGFGYQYGVTSTFNLGTKLELLTDIGLENSSFSYDGNTFDSDYSFYPSKIGAEVNYRGLNLAAILRYRLSKGDNRKLRPGLTTFAGLGLTTALPQTYTANYYFYSGWFAVVPGTPPVDLTANMRTVLLSARAEVGAKYLLGEVLLRIDLSYTHGLTNTFPNGVRISTVSFDFASPLSGTLLESLQLSIGAEVPLYKPKRLVR